MAFTVTTWNLQGSHGVDIDAVAGHLKDVGSDVVALQEVQRKQAQGIAKALAARSRRWGFKHRPVTVRAEGMALLGVTHPLSDVCMSALTARWRPWSWRRRIYQWGTVEVPGGDAALMLGNLHLSPHADGRDHRERELATVLHAIGGEHQYLVITGDFNARQGDGLLGQMDRAGLSSAGEGRTNWGGTPADRPADQQLDYLYVSRGLRVEEVILPRHGDQGFGLFPLLSDHLPLSVRLATKS